MKTKLYPDLDLPDRLAQIKAEAVKVETMEFEKPLSEDEYNSLKEEQSILALKIYKLEKRKKRLLDEIANEKKPADLKQKEVLAAMDTRTMNVEGNVYSVPDHDNNIMYFVSEEGHVVQARALTQEERQLNFTISKPDATLKAAANE